MNKKNFLKLSLYSFISSVTIFILNYFFFHFVTDQGISSIWQPEPGKPFVTDLIGILAVLFLFTSIICLFISIIFFPKENKNN